MHKHIAVWVVAVATLAIAAIFSLSAASADDSSPWLSSPLSYQKQADTQSLPTSLHGNIDCGLEDTIICSVPTAYGAAGQNGSVRLNGDNGFKPVLSYIDNRQHILPVPNSNTVISYTSEPVYGFYLYFNYNFSSSITKIPDSGLLGSDQFQINRPPDGKLADRASHLLAADYTSIGFSQNGRWLAVSSPNVAMLRVDLQTFEVLPFAPGFDYSLGLDPDVKTAISNDGRYAIAASKNFGRFAIYDLNSCAATPENIVGPAACQSRDLRGFMQQKFPDFSFVDSVRFSSDDLLNLYANYQSGAESKAARFSISTSSIASQIDYLALGDSYISGEGAFDYQSGTDTADNRCHLSLIAYPYLIGQDLNYNSYHSVACSGATSSDIANRNEEYRGQAQHKQVARGDRSAAEIDTIFASFKPGYINQQDFVSRYQPKINTISIGGNDMGFGEIVKTCALGVSACYSTYEDRLELVRQINTQVFPKLARTYQQLKTTSLPDARIYAIGYPQIAKPDGDCALNVHLDADETLFSEQLINYLDSVIQQAANKAGIYYADTQDALSGHRLCEAGPGSVAMNGLTLGNDRPSRLGGPIGAESYHPNDFGYQLLENKVLAATHNLTAPMPAANPDASPPAENNLEILNVPGSGRHVNVVEYDTNISDDLVLQQIPVAINISGSEHALRGYTNLQAEVHSTAVKLGSYTTNSSGDLSTQITLTSDIPPGYHSLHFFGTNLSGQAIDIYKIIYVASGASDLNVDGLADASQACSGIVLPSSTDLDQDGIDDSCDGNISQPASGQSPPAAVQLDSANVANSSQAPTPSTQNHKAVQGRVLADSVTTPPANKFEIGWLLALIPASLSIFYLFKKD